METAEKLAQVYHFLYLSLHQALATIAFFGTFFSEVIFFNDLFTGETSREEQLFFSRRPFQGINCNFLCLTFHLTLQS